MKQVNKETEISKETLERMANVLFEMFLDNLKLELDKKSQLKK